MTKLDQSSAGSHEPSDKKKKPILQLLLILVLGIVVRFLLWGAFDNLFDWVLYPIVVGKFGFVFGTAAMMLLSGLICLLLLWIYDKAKVDVLGLEAEKRLLEQAVQEDYASYSAKSKLRALLTIVVMPIATDAFMTTVRLRPHGTHVMRAQEWIIFSTSVFVSNLGWGVFTAGWTWGVLQLIPYVHQSMVSTIILLFITTLSVFYCPFAPKKRKK